MIRLETLETSQRGSLTRAAVGCDGCGVNGPWVVCGKSGDHWDTAYAANRAIACGWVERMTGNVAGHICPVCQREEKAAKSATGQLALFGGRHG